jgi:hypothetical protein
MPPRTTGQDGRQGDPIRTDAAETLVLWPSGLNDVDMSRAPTDPWPVFVVVVNTGDAEDTPAARALLEVLDTPRTPVDTITNSECWWSVHDSHGALLRLAVRVSRPARVALDIVVPAQCFLGLSDIIAAGATVSVTTRQRARRLAVRTDDRASLDEIVLLGGRTSSELGDLAELLCGARDRS